MVRQGDAAIDERTVEPAHMAVAAALACRILHVPAVLAVDPHRHAARPMPGRRPRARRDFAVCTTAGSSSLNKRNRRGYSRTRCPSFLPSAMQRTSGRSIRLANCAETSVNATTACRHWDRGMRLIRLTIPFSSPPIPKRKTTWTMRGGGASFGLRDGVQGASAAGRFSTWASAASIDGAISRANSLSVIRRGVGFTGHREPQ